MKQKPVAAGEFKNSCLRIMESVHQSGIPVLVTKRGKPLVRSLGAPVVTADRRILEYSHVPTIW